MSNLLDPDRLPYFFGPHFDVEVALATAANLPDLGELCESIEHSIGEGVTHTGLQLIGYENVDSGLSALAAVSRRDAPSMISFFAESSHRVFGGATLVCVPLVFCSPHFRPHGEYVVYRHTYKRPVVTATEYSHIMEFGSGEDKTKLILLTRSREGFRTIPGMSYVGVSKRPWQQRLREHIDSAMQKQSTTKLHETIRQMQGQNVIHVHDISAFGLSEAEAREYESKLIATSTLSPLGLNMKP